MPLAPRDVVAVGGAALAAIALGAAGWMALSPDLGSAASRAAPSTGATLGGFVASASASAAPLAPSQLLVDVQGGVARPGLVRLPAGARVADAVAAAGGYTRQTDLFAAATTINLAAALTDGAQVFVPVRGMTAALPSAGVGTVGGTGGTGLVNLNTATPEELEELPGIGPVTAQKIIAARAEQPFTTLEELVERDVMHSGQLEDIRTLVTL
ncbi:MAG TPA: helix-hairpin-helix domain-containing protein [Candidatus Limnocylindria bacterium]|nr:helix-hairpin-helix domain-containing protein [Candidatus Limnocylindria bacterium]